MAAIAAAATAGERRGPAGRLHTASPAGAPLDPCSNGYLTGRIVLTAARSAPSVTHHYRPAGAAMRIALQHGTQSHRQARNEIAVKIASHGNGRG
jgi:hypothetical protein